MVYMFTMREYLYRVAHLVVDNRLLTSNWELRFRIKSLYCESVMEHLISCQQIVVPCTVNGLVTII